VPDGGAYERGVSAGEIAQRLHDHDEHFGDINGSLDGVAKELRSLTLAIQRLGDAADADRATVRTTATALKEAEQARRDSSESRWSPTAKVIAVIGALAAVATVVTLVLANLHH
jgi:DNA-binding IclR family transcriptional regulator